MTGEPFGRQPRAVTIIVAGEPEDVQFWKQEFMRRASYKGDDVQNLNKRTFRIYPRAVND